MKEKYYFEISEYNNENCYVLEYWKVTAKERNVPIEIEGAKINYGDKTFYCAFNELT